MKKVFIPIALAAAMAMSAFLVACGDETDAGTGNNPTPDPNPNPKPPPTVTTTDKWRDESIWMTAEDLVPTDAAELPEDVGYKIPTGSVHDPSVFHDPVSGYYYAYGTHYAVAKTYYLADAFRSDKEGGWEQLAGDNNFQFLYGNDVYNYGGTKWPAALESTLDLVKPGGSNPGTTTWAPDVEYINGKYYMYYSLTKAFGSNESAIARVESDSPEGPFTNNTIIIDSIGATRSTDPNCIDPELFYDKEGKLWMVYGSDMGGIFIKELYADGENVGLPKHTKEEEGFGKKLWRGGSNQEGPFIYYNAATDYYYLMCSYNSLMVTYNMHVARSKNPDGPYVGIDGKDVAVDGSGNQVAGNFKFNRDGGSVNGFAAMGHNSVVKDADGKYYVIYHARRFSSTAAGATSGTVSQPHNLYVSQLYFNEEGWPVMAPTPYVGETRGTFTEDQIASAAYDVVVHAMPTGNASNYTATLVNSVAYTLNADGTVTGGATGSWTLTDGYYIELTLGSVTYKGVVAPGWDIYTSNTSKQKGVITISAISNTGASLWAVQK